MGGSSLPSFARRCFSMGKNGRLCLPGWLFWHLFVREGHQSIGDNGYLFHFLCDLLQLAGTGGFHDKFGCRFVISCSGDRKKAEPEGSGS
jgi:hypothetical protein